MNKIIDFIKSNGYKEETEKNSEYRSFFKEGVSSIDISNDEIVLIGEQGDWLHLPINYYSLLGALIHHRQLACDYVA
jgi:hypothetical protein